MKVLFLIRSLNRGGAERQLITLATGLVARGNRCTIVAFYEGGALEPELKGTGVQLLHVGKSGRWDALGFARRLVSIVRSANPDVLYSFLTVSNLLAVLLKPWLRGVPIVWSRRVGEIDMRQYDRFQQVTYGIEPFLVRGAALVIANSQAGKIASVSRGFSESKVIVIENGTDTARFAPNAEVRRSVRSTWKVADDEVVICAVGRIDPVKDYPTFLRAAAHLAKAHPRLRFQIVGDGSEEPCAALAGLAEQLGIGGGFHLLPGNAQIEQVYCAIDMLVSSSNAEGFPNVIAEAMASGVPCAVTDVGDAKRIVGETGEVAPPQQEVALAAAMERLLARLSPELSATARTRIVENFSVGRMVEHTEMRLQQVVDASVLKADRKAQRKA